MSRRARITFSAFGIASATCAIGACTGDDDVFRDAPMYTYDASASDLPRPPTSAADAATPGRACGDATGAPARALVVSRARPSELAAVNLETSTVDGRLAFDGGTGITSTTTFDAWLLDQESDIVTRLDAREPWKPVAQWNVRGDDGAGPAMPIAVVQVSCTKAYVVRGNRDRIAIIDPSSATGEPTGFIDLAPFRAPTDTGTLDVAGAVFVPSKRKVFVLAGNVDRERTVAGGGLRCVDTLHASIFGVDVMSDQVVSLAGKGAAGAIEVDGYDPPSAGSLLYDAPFDRLLVLGRGCAAPADGGVFGAARRRIEQVDLATGAVKVLLSLEHRPPPTSFALASGDHAVVLFGSNAYLWNPRENALGVALPGGGEAIAEDGRGAFIGARRRNAALELFALPLGDAGVSRVILTDPFTTPGGNAASLEPWPRR